jgi:hypothetical protein
MKKEQLKETEKIILELGRKALRASCGDMHEASLAYATAAKSLADASYTMANSYEQAAFNPDYTEKLNDD